MKRYWILLSLFTLLTIIVHASTPLDNRSRAIVESVKQREGLMLDKSCDMMAAKSSAVGHNDIYYPVIIKLSNDSVIDDLEALGSVIMHQRENFLLACIPYSQLDTISRLPLINRLSLSAPMSTTLDSARDMSNVNLVQQGVNLPQSYNGKGIVVGFSDIGFDPSHPNFTDGRLSRFIHYDELHALKYDMETPQEMQQFADTTEWHATHVAGILAGGYKGLPYWGVAPGAEIVATTSSLYDMAILSGVEDVINHAKNKGVPAVVNLSVGYNLGPHDGTSLFNQYLDLLGEEAIICLSSGNDGKKRVYLSFDAKKDGDELKTFVYDNPNVCGIEMHGAIDLWSGDDREFLVALTIYDRITKEFVYTSPFVGSVNGGASSWGIASSSQSTDNDISIPLFESDLTGSVRIYSSLNLENNRYNVYATIDVKNHQFDSSGVLGRYCVGFIARAQAGMHIDAYSDASRLVFNALGVEGFSNGTPERSVSDLACGRNVIVVGASNSRNLAPRVDGSEKSYNFNVDNVADFSAYGTLEDGRKLPHICAPGNMIVSSINSHYTNRLSESELNTLAAKTTIGGKDYYWFSECGTSMSSPHAAGVIACWLQADSSLTVHEIKDIAQSTARTDYSDINSPKWGAGNIDAYAGLKEVLKRGGVGNVLADEEAKVIFTPIAYRQFRVEMPNIEIQEVMMYTTTGKLVLATKSQEVNATSLSPGVYIVRVLHSKGELVERILIK